MEEIWKKRFWKYKKIVNRENTEENRKDMKIWKKVSWIVKDMENMEKSQVE